MDALVAIVHILSLWFWESVIGLTEAYNFVNISPFSFDLGFVLNNFGSNSTFLLSIMLLYEFGT